MCKQKTVRATVFKGRSDQRTTQRATQRNEQRKLQIYAVSSAPVLFQYTSGNFFYETQLDELSLG